MARKTPYIQTKQEIKIDKNFSDSLNTMITHIEIIDKLKEENKFDTKYKVQLEQNIDYKFITIKYNSNNGKYILEMVEDLKTCNMYYKVKNPNDTSYQILYIKSEAIKNKKDSNFIDSKVNEIEFIKEEHLSLFLDLLYEYDTNNENSFFKNSKEECISLISKKIGSEFSAKKLYTMIRNKINIVGEIEVYKEQTSNNKIDSIKNKVKDFNKEFDIQYKNIIDILNERILDSKRRIEEFKKECSKNLIIVYNEQEEENENMSNRFYYSFNGDFTDSWFEDGISKYPMEKELVYSTLANEQKELFDKEQELTISRYEKIANEKIQRSIDMIYIIYDLLDEYYDIKLFEKRELKSKKIKRTSTVIKKYYQYKIKNMSKFKDSFDRYIDNREIRAKKVKEIEYLDRLIIENKDMLNNIFYFDRDIVDKDYNITPNSSNEELGYYHSEQIFSDKLLDYLYQKYNKNIFLLKEKKAQINKIVNFHLYVMNGVIEEIDLFHNRDIYAKNDKIYFKKSLTFSAKYKRVKIKDKSFRILYKEYIYKSKKYVIECDTNLRSKFIDKIILDGRKRIEEEENYDPFEWGKVIYKIGLDDGGSKIPF